MRNLLNNLYFASFLLLLTNVLNVHCHANPNFSVPPNFQPGAIINHDMNYLMLQQRTPWITSPNSRQDARYKEPKIYVEEGTIPGEACAQGMLIAPDGTGYISGDE